MSMDIWNINRKLRLVLPGGAPDAGLQSLRRLGMLSCVVAHRLHDVSLPESTVIIVLEGIKTAHRGGATVTVPAGSGFLFPARMEITSENVPDGGSGRYAALCLTYEEAMIARVADALCAVKAPSSFALDDLQMSCDATIEASLCHLLDMAAAFPENTRLIDLCREELLLVVAGRSRAMPLLWQAATSWSSRCASVVGMEPGRAWTVDLVAGKLGTSERSLRRHLGGEGTGFTKILQDVRLNAGLSLLQTGRHSVGEAAYQCGYQSASRFAGLFRDRFGVNPSEVLQFNAVSGASLAEL